MINESKANWLGTSPRHVVTYQSQ